MAMKKPVASAPAPRMSENEIRMDERLRLASILESEEGKKHPKAALKFALHTNMSPAAANDIMSSMPAESPFLDAMAKEGEVNIGTAFGQSAVTGDKKSARKAELAQVAEGYAVGRGYRKSKD